MTRDYSHLQLPYTLPAWKVSIAVRMIVDANMWKRLSYELATKINDAVTGRHDLVVTQADLDSLPDDAWEYLKSKIG
jgi:hypothetical protein